MYAIGIDIGTTNTKALALSGMGEVVFELSAPTRVIEVPSGGEIDPKELTADIVALLRNVIARARELTDEPLGAIGITGMAEAGCLVDLEGEPETPILLWYDQRGRDEAEELRPRFEDRLTSVSGIRMSNVATIYKLCYLKKQLPLLNGMVCRWIGVPEWAAWILSGEHFTDRTLAVRTGAYSLKTNAWSEELLRILDLDPDLFPDIVPVGQQTAHVSEFMAETLGISPDVRIMIAGHDDMAAAYGAGLSAGTWVDSTGTAEGLIALTDVLPDPRQTVRNRMSIAPWYSGNAWALIAGIGTSGSLLKELHLQTGLDYSEIDALAKENAECPPDALSVELTPQRLAKVSFADGLTHAQMVSAVYGRILENFAERARQIMRFAEPPNRLVITGGQASLSELSRRKSEALGGIPTESRPKPEAAAYGAAKMCML